MGECQPSLFPASELSVAYPNTAFLLYPGLLFLLFEGWYYKIANEK